MGLGSSARGKGERTRAASLFDADPARAYRRSASLLFKGGVFWRRFLAWLLLAWVQLGCEGASRQRRDSSSRGLTLCSSPPGLTRWSMPNGRVQFGPTSVLRSSMDRRGIGERSDAVLRTAMPGDDESFRSRDAPSHPSFAKKTPRKAKPRNSSLKRREAERREAHHRAASKSDAARVLSPSSLRRTEA